jgi:hypothetical protein
MASTRSTAIEPTRTGGPCSSARRHGHHQSSSSQRSYRRQIRHADCLKARAELRSPIALDATKPSVPRLALSIAETCESMGVSWDFWRQNIEADVRLVRIGRRKLVPVRELELWLAEHAEKAIECR